MVTYTVTVSPNLLDLSNHGPAQQQLLFLLIHRLPPTTREQEIQPVGSHILLIPSHPHPKPTTSETADLSVFVCHAASTLMQACCTVFLHLGGETSEYLQSQFSSCVFFHFLSLSGPRLIRPLPRTHDFDVEGLTIRSATVDLKSRLPSAQK